MSATAFPLLTPDDVAERLRCSRKNVYRLLGGSLPVVRMGRLVRVTEEDLAAWIATHRQENETWEGSSSARRAERGGATGPTSAANDTNEASAPTTEPSPESASVPARWLHRGRRAPRSTG